MTSATKAAVFAVFGGGLLAMSSVVAMPSSVQAAATEPYQVLVRPAVATNPLNTEHQFIVEVRTDSDGDFAVDEPVLGATVDLSWTGPAGSRIVAVNGVGVPANPFNTATCVTTSSPTVPNGGVCNVDVQSPPDVGTGTLTGSFNVPGATPGAPELPVPPADRGTTCTGAYVPGPIIESCEIWVDVQRIQATATHTWIGYFANVDPDAVLPVGVSHVFDLGITIVNGTTSVPANAVTANLGWLNAPAGSDIIQIDATPAPGARSCVTSAIGTCTATVLSDVPGTGTLRVDSIVGALIGGQVKTESPTPSSVRTAMATWVDWRILITPPSATNRVDDPHVFTLELQRNNGTGWVAEAAGNTISTTWGGPVGSAITAATLGTVISPTSATCTTNGDGQCTITVTSPSVGPGTLTATDIMVSLPGYVPPGGTGASFAFDVDDAAGTKTWIDFFATVGPSAINLAGDPHTFTIDTTYDDGTGQQPVPDGSTVDFSWAGPGTAQPANSCTTTGGSCTVVVSSPEADAGELTIETVSAVINGAVFSDEVPLTVAGGSLDATKTWIELFADVGPSATNLIGDPHVFTIDVTYDDGARIRPVPNGSTVTYRWSGVGTANPPSSCITVSGSCTVTVVSSTTGSGTITVQRVTTTIGGETFTNATPAAAAGGSLDATKVWVDYRIVVTPETDENLVNTEHVFTITVERSSGMGFVPFAGAIPDIELSGVGIIIDETCSTGTRANGRCTVTTQSSEAGNMTLTATLEAAEATSTTLPPSDSGDKLWINYRVTLTPERAINEVNDPHVFEALLEVDTGGGFVPAGQEQLAIGATGVGAIVGIDAPGLAPSSCVTDNAGTCRIAVNSTIPGTLFLTATYQATVGNTAGTFQDDASKGWIVIELPATGSESIGMLQLGMGTALGGLVLLLAARRRRLDLVG